MYSHNRILFSGTLANAVIRHDGVNKRQSSNAFPPLQSVKILEQVQERVRYLHYSPLIEEAYLYWIRFFYAGPVCVTRAKWVRMRFASS